MSLQSKWLPKCCVCLSSVIHSIHIDYQKVHQSRNLYVENGLLVAAKFLIGPCPFYTLKGMFFFKNFDQ